MSRRNALLSSFRLTERLLRLEPRTACILDDENVIVSSQGYIYRVNMKNGTVAEELKLRNGMNNPLSFVSVEELDGFTDVVMFGEYFSNNQFEAVNLWRRLGGKWEVALTLPAGSLYHIHAVVPDYNHGCVYVLTGDSDTESAIIKVTDDFKSMEPVLESSQQYRSCVAFPYKQGILYATDTPREVNHVYYAYPTESGWKTEPVCELPGPCIYGHQQKGYYFFATSVEADDTLSESRYRFSYKLGAGVKGRESHVIELNQDLVVKDVLALKKDLWPILLFQFGNCSFPVNENENVLIVCPQSVKHYDGKTLIINI